MIIKNLVYFICLFLLLKQSNRITQSTLFFVVFAINEAIAWNYHKPRLLYSRTKLKDGELRSFKHVLNDFQFVCGSVFQEIMLDKNNPDEPVLSKVFAHENISCKSPIELLYYSYKAFKQVCIQCGKASKLIFDPQHYP